MHILLSPAKTLDMDCTKIVPSNSMNPFLDQAQKLINELQRFTISEIQSLMKVSSKIAELNVNRFNEWKLPFTQSNAKAALYAFKGDVYTGINASTFSDDDLNFAQDHLSILSGLYGILRPKDLMKAYRLEMGTKLNNEYGKDLYQFWGNKITDEINKRENEYIINLASNEYFKAVNKKIINAKIITPVFKDKKNGHLKVIGFFAKKARGMMTRFIVQKRIKNPEEIKLFQEGGYSFTENLSTNNEWIFTR